MSVQASAAFWLKKEHEARCTAERLRDPTSKRALMKVAAKCAHLARLALLVEMGTWQFTE